MEDRDQIPTTIDDYLAAFPVDVALRMQTLRTVIKEEVPEATETISWRMPTFVYHGNLVHFAGFKHHIGFYPTPSGIEEFQEELSLYKGGKGSIQFPYDKPMPYDLIRRMVRFRAEENRKRVGEK